ncbi:MAG: cytochrome b [Burkholderiales bacterium]|jgi:cytochrome b561|nr:cytochrome b [Burkholderiales bacterium]
MSERYDNLTIALHWLIAAAFIAEIALGIYLNDVPRGTPARAYWVGLHKSIGVTVGLAGIVLLARRLAVKPPELPASLAAWERTAANAGHVLLYICVIGIPLAGYLASNFSRFGIKYFGLFELKPWGPDDKRMYSFFNGVHDWLAWTAAVLVAIHVAAALKHALIDRDRVLQRMVPSRAAVAARTRS